VRSEASRPRPALEVVEDPAGPQPEEPRIWLRAFMAVAVLLLLALLALGVQTRRVGELEGRVEALEAELGSARDELAAHEARLGRARDLVDDLGGRLQELRTLLAPEPGAGPGETL
jgi:Tfp pilus assembly protein PilN